MRKSQAGFTTIASIIIVILLIIMGIGLLTMITSGTRIAPIGRDALEAEYAAEAGAKRAIIEFNKINSDPTSPVWTWLGSEIAFVNDVNTKKYKVLICDDNADHNIALTPKFDKNYKYLIQSTGTVGKARKTVTVKVEVKGGGGSPGSDVFGKFGLFSNQKMQIDNTPKIVGDVGSNNTITVNSSSPLINGKAYTPNVPVMDQWTWNRNAVTGGYQYANPAGTLDVASLIPKMPDWTYSGTQLNPASGATLTNSSYFYNGNFTTGKTYTAVSGTSVTIYINGNLQLTKQSETSAAIRGDNVTIYVTGNVILDNSSSIQASNLKIYAKGTMQLTNDAAISGNNVTLQTSGSINFNSNSSINKNSTSAVTKIYSDSDIQLTNKFTLGGSAALVATSSYVNINSSAVGSNTVFVAGSGASQITNSCQIAGIYTNGSLAINSSPQINSNSQKTSVIETLGLNGSKPSATVIPGSWTSK